MATATFPGAEFQQGRPVADPSRPSGQASARSCARPRPARAPVPDVTPSEMFPRAAAAGIQSGQGRFGDQEGADVLEVVALSALTTFLMSVGNGAAGEMGKQLLLSTGTLVRRTTGRRTPLPSGPEERAALAGLMHARLEHDPRLAGEWALLLRTHGQPGTPVLARGSGLPPAPRHFTNRQKTLRRLAREATRPADGRPRVALLFGPPGIGTTATALRLGAEQHARFPDGQFYVDLRDTAADGGPGPGGVLQRLLRQMVTDPGPLPPTDAGREELYRRVTADRRALVVVDHATSLAQVRGLVPSTDGVFLLVVVSGQPFALEAERVEVEPLSDRYAVRMLRELAGREHVAHAGAQLPRLLGQCGGNAFALRAAAGQLRTGQPALPPPASQDGDRHPVREAVRHATGRLRPPTARLCRLAALGAWPGLDTHLAAAVADVPPDEAAGMLAEAVDAQVLESLPDDRHRFRPEVRRYLADTAGPELGVAECSAAVARGLDAVLNRALHAAHAALPESWRTEPAPSHGTGYGDESEGLRALVAEAGNTVRAVSLAEEYGHVSTALRLARTLWPLQLKAGHWDDVLPALRLAARCAGTHRPGTRTAGALHFQLAHCLDQLGRGQDAERAARAALDSERAAGHLRGEASAVELLGLLRLHQWDYPAAYERFTEAKSLYEQIAPGQEGAEDLPRALALAERHRGRALRGMGRTEESQRSLQHAVDRFEEQGERYNTARALTDLAETLHDAGRDTEALARISEAERLLDPAAVPHRQYLTALRSRCGSAE
ncbi:tetratricopeptide repeat protein [Streptomyces sp. NPDC057245]|uniref:tetratricopeptide repeat protein n=1 Tax=Streptomyces sp. NPDC057245 TaxID=3346065 RepID=UPI00364510D9